VTVTTLRKAAAPSRPAHVIACVAGGDVDLLLMRQAWSWASRLGAMLTVLHVLPADGRGHHGEMIAADRALAAALGAPLIELPAYSVLDGIAEFAAERGVTHIVLNEPAAAQRWPVSRPPLSQALAARLQGIEILIFNRVAAGAEA
jgi:K+-sensing histidine kinase KdpD